MRNFQDKRSFKRVLQSKPVLFLLFLVFLVFAWGVFGFLGKMQETRKNKNNAYDKLEELKREKVRLSGEIDKLQTEEGVEATIREKFGLAKEGEGLIVVVDDKNGAEEVMVEESGGFFLFLKNLFK